MHQKPSNDGPPYQPAIGPLGDVAYVFRRLGGLSRLDVVFSMIGVACVAFWSCLKSGKRKAVRASLKPTVYLLSYIPSPDGSVSETA